MRTWFHSHWDALRGTFWFVPLLMVITSAVLSLIALALDKAAMDSGLELRLGWTFDRGADGSRALLSTVAGSMLTIASVSFSITIVALQQASSQFGPRLLYNFMRDRGNQLVLGTFISGFTYCLLILRTINGTQNHSFVPHLSVTIGLLYALAGVAVLIYFIHHAATSIQAEHVIAKVSRELQQALDRMFPSELGEEPEPSAFDIELPKDFATESVAVTSNDSNYLQALDGDRLLRLACEHDLVINLEHRPGQFIVEGNSLARGWPAERMTDDLASSIRGAFYFGNRRTLLQDPEFAIDQLVEIAVRALSPGINDPFTAIACIDRLGAALAELAGKEIPSPYRYDEEGRLRLVANSVNDSGIVDASFHQIRQAALSSAAVTIRLLETIGALAARVKSPAFRLALISQAEVIFEGSRTGLTAEIDRQDALERYRELRVAFGMEPI